MYKINDKVLLEKPGKVPKMSLPQTGLYDVMAVHDNGTISICKGAVTHHINMCRLIPYFS